MLNEAEARRIYERSGRESGVPVVALRSLQLCAEAVEQGDLLRATELLTATEAGLEAEWKAKLREAERLNRFIIENLDNLAFALHHLDSQEVATILSRALAELSTLAKTERGGS